MTPREAHESWARVRQAVRLGQEGDLSELAREAGAALAELQEAELLSDAPRRRSGIERLRVLVEGLRRRGIESEVPQGLLLTADGRLHRIEPEVEETGLVLRGALPRPSLRTPEEIHAKARAYLQRSEVLIPIEILESGYLGRPHVGWRTQASTKILVALNLYEAPVSEVEPMWFAFRGFSFGRKARRARETDEKLEPPPAGFLSGGVVDTHPTLFHEILLARCEELAGVDPGSTGYP